MKYLWVLICLLLAGCLSPNAGKINFAAPGMPKAQVMQLMGNPDVTAYQDNMDYLFYRVHDHALGREKNNYYFVFKEDSLTEYGPTASQDLDDFSKLIKYRMANPRPSVTIINK